MRLLGLVLLAPLLALPAPAVVVSFTATHRIGYGDGGNPPTTPTIRNNALPACNGGFGATTASIPAAGFAEVGAGPGPRSLKPIRGHFEKFQLGSAGSPTPTYFGKPGVAGLNGAAEFHLSTCTFKNEVWSWTRTNRTQRSFFTAPADKSIQVSTTASGMRLFAPGPGDEMHTLRAGGGPGSFSVPLPTVPAGPQQLSGMAGANQFGGGWRASAGGTLDLNVIAGTGLSHAGSLPLGPRFQGHGALPVTQAVTRTGTFTFVQTGGMMPVEMKVWALPFTTGTVRVEAPAGTTWYSGGTAEFVTIRTQTGFDNRNAAGTTGSLLLVSPWIANIGPPLNIRFGGTAELEFQFLPEPAATGLLGVGIAALLVLQLGTRRRR